MTYRTARFALFVGAGTLAMLTHGTALAALPGQSDRDSVAQRDDQDRDADTIVVTGKRVAIEKAQTEQVNNASLVSIISGEELRAQPQQNLADLLTRLPGLSASVNQAYNAAATGESQYVTIRGLDSAYNAYAFDGVRLAQTDAGTRAISMNLLSPFSLAEVRVDKAPTAARDGDAIAGVIDFRTASALNLPDHHLQIRAQGQLAGRAAARDQDRWGGAMQLETAQRLGAIGIYASAYYGKKNVYSESVAPHKDYINYNNTITGNARDHLDNLFARGVEWNVFQNRIERFGGTLNIDWKSDALDLYSRSTYGEYRLKSWMDQVAVRQVSLSSGQVNPNPRSGMYDANGYAAIYGTGASNYFRTEHSNQRLIVSQLGGEARLGALTVDFHGAYSRGKTEYPFRLQDKYQTPAYIGAATGSNVARFRLVTSLTDPINPQVVLDDGARAALTNLSNYLATYSIVQFEHVTESKGEGVVDATYHLADRGLTALQAGAKYESAKRDSNSIDESLEYDYSGSSIPNLASVPGKTVNGFMRNGAQVPIFVPAIDFIEAQGRSLSLSQLASADPTLLQRNLLRGTEQRASAYLLAKFGFGALSILPGLRFEHNRFGATYWADDVVAGTTASGFTTSTKAYDEWLPSVIAAYRPDAATVYRLSARRSYARPAFGMLLGPTRRTYDVQGNPPVTTLTSVSVSNPDLKATTAWNVDASFERKGAGTDLFSVALYYKRLSNVMFSTSITSYTVGETVPAGADGVAINATSTDGKGDVYGAELFGRYSPSFLPGALRGLGVQGTVTVQKAQSTIKVDATHWVKLRMPGAPQVMFDAELFYNRGPVSAAVDYAYSGDKLIAVRYPSPDAYLQPASNMNVTMSYDVGGGLTAGVAVQNVLNSHSYWATYGTGTGLLGHDRTGGYIEVGRTYLLNLSYRF
ncbi:TonB-dependent receptor [Sphingomonas sp. MA1305]|uniref:TonB-dependent receptor n=1 Tax=Sphingomonas sp. MA1305 TaxID=2479204 RepID=UPI0018E0026F|nr:TonB-dependent receptor [Sphingomonas sp. MA1305]MBI0475863.1 TonB-dependent receptor [Sphingomonas sp. MA1305]